MTTVSIIVPAYNEAGFLADTLTAIHEAMNFMDKQAWELIVVDNDSTDNTAEIATSCGAIVVFEAEHKIARVRNAGAAVAKGRYFVFIDADTKVESPVIQDALEVLDGDVGAGGALIGFDRVVSLPGRFLAGCWNKASKMLSWAAGSFVFCRREGFEAVGGFPESVYAAEDVLFSKRIKKWLKQSGLKFRVLTTGGIKTSARKMEGRKIITSLLQIICLTLFPWLLYSRRGCWMWYRGR